MDDDIILEGGPAVYFEDRRGNYRFNPDSDGFYWGLSGTPTYPVWEVGCYENFKFSDNVEVNDIRCDRVGVIASVQKRNYVEVTFDLKSFFPLTVLRHMLKGGGPVTQNLADESEKFGLGVINNLLYWKVFFPVLYDEDADDFLSVTLHKAQFVDNWDWQWRYGDTHMVNITLRGYADQDRDSVQRFATISRVDVSEL